MGKARFGIDVLLENLWPVAGRRIGLITNPSGVTAAGVPTWKALRAAPNVRLVRLFGPEHGLEGGAVYMEAVASAIHKPSGLPVVSLYGAAAEDLKPRREDFADLEAIVFDVQDVGSRYYTYIWTMLLAMEACAASRLRFVVCDRPNPIGGAIEGAPQATGYLTFVGLHPIPVRHGMTAGELARLFAQERRLDLDLVVCPVAGWTRETPWEKTGLPWVAPSPNMPTVGHGTRLPGHVPSRGNESLRGARDDPALRGVRSPVARRRGAGRDAQRSRAAGRAVSAVPVPSDVRQARGRRLQRRAAPRHGPRGVPALSDRSAHHRGGAAPRAARLPLAHRALRVRHPAGDRSADGLGPLPRHRRARGKSPRRDHAPLRRGPAVCRAPRALPPLPGPQARRRGLRRAATTRGRRPSSSRSCRGSRRAASSSAPSSTPPRTPRTTCPARTRSVTPPPAPPPRPS